MAQPATREMKRWATRSTVPAWREPVGSRTTIEPAISSIRGSSARMPVSPIRRYSSTVNRRRLTASAIVVPFNQGRVALGISVQHVKIQVPADVDDALVAIARSRENLVVLEDAMINVCSNEIANVTA